jgi:hypothetical protein
MSQREGIEIDYCPQCRGVWLDRGELDKIIERSTTMSRGRDRDDDDDDYRRREGSYRGDDRHRDGGYYGGQPPRKKKGFLGDLFDFD